MIDLIAKLGIPVILVARSSLGTINHTLLSIETLRQRKIPILGVILNGKPNAENAKSIAIFGSNLIISYEYLNLLKNFNCKQIIIKILIFRDNNFGTIRLARIK